MIMINKTTITTHGHIKHLTAIYMIKISQNISRYNNVAPGKSLVMIKNLVDIFSLNWVFPMLNYACIDNTIYE